MSFFESKVEAITLSRERICIPRPWFCYEARARNLFKKGLARARLSFINN